MSTDVGLVQEHETGSNPGVAVENLGSNDRAGLYETFVWVETDAQWFLYFG